MKHVYALAVVLALGACGDNASAPSAPQAVTPGREANTHFGHMILVDHAGPKAQIHLKSQTAPLWFPAVRDARAFVLLPDQPKDVVAIYVTDMGRATDWTQATPDAWIPAESAVYVVGSGCIGGMGAPEPVPFSDPAMAESFAAKRGGRVVGWADISDTDVLGDAMPGAGMAPDAMPHQAMPHDTMPMPMGGGAGECAMDFPVPGASQ